jgi:hypothetical protein
MHPGIGLTMHLDYSVMAAVVLVVLVDWPTLADRVHPSGQGDAPGPVPVEERP